MTATRIFQLILLVIVLTLSNVVSQPTRRNRVPQQSWDQYALKINQEVPQFGGFWYENNRLVIGLTSLTTTAKNKSKLIVLALLKERESASAPIIFRRVDNNFATIHGARKKIRVLFRDKKITFLDTDERSNKVRIGVAKAEDRSGVADSVRRLGIPDGLFEIEIKPATVDYDDSDLRQHVRPLVGGVQIRRGGRCTLGVLGMRNGIRGFLTASHCTQTQGQFDGSVFFQPETGNAANRIGAEVADSPILRNSDTEECPEGERCQYADVAFISLDDNIMARRGYVSAPSPIAHYKITGVSPLGVCGMEVVKVGRTTGTTGGEVDGTCSDHMTTSGIYKLCQDTITTRADHGDSGAAVLARRPSQSEMHFYGILHGGDGTDARMTPYFLVLSQIGAVDVMPGNDPPRVRITSPTHGASFGMNPLSDTVRFEASIFDPEGKECGTNNSTCTVEWRSDKDGLIGTGRTAEFLFKTRGLHSITATAKDGSQTAADQIAINISSTPPNITVVEPNGGPYYRGMNYVLYATATDSDVSLLAPVECNRFTWSSNNQADLGSGTKLPENFCEVIHTFTTVGSRTLSVQARDPGGDANTKTIPINVVNPPTSGPPIVSLLITSRVIGRQPNTIYNLRAAMIDPDGGQRLSYKWKVKYGNTEKVIKSAQRGGAAQISDPWRPSDHVPNRCGGWNATLTLEVEDDQGQKSSATLPIFVTYPLC